MFNDYRGCFLKNMNMTSKEKVLIVIQFVRYLFDVYVFMYNCMDVLMDAHLYIWMCGCKYDACVCLCIHASRGV